MKGVAVLDYQLAPFMGSEAALLARLLYPFSGPRTLDRTTGAPATLLQPRLWPDAVPKHSIRECEECQFVVDFWITLCMADSGPKE